VPPEPAVTETVTWVLPATPVGVPGVPGIVGAAVVVAVAPDPEPRNSRVKDSLFSLKYVGSQTPKSTTA